MKTVYVGMGLTQAPEEFRTDFQHELKDRLRVLPEIEILDFYGVELSSSEDDVSEEVYELDRKHTESADLVVFVADYPSIGLGMEIALRLATRKQMLVCSHEDAIITRMLLGMCKKENVEFIRYKDVEDIVTKVKGKL